MHENCNKPIRCPMDKKMIFPKIGVLEINVLTSIEMTSNDVNCRGWVYISL